MNAEQLRAMQAPIKQRYRDTPDTARAWGRKLAPAIRDAVAKALS